MKEVRHPQGALTGNKGGLLQTANLAVESLAALGARHKIKEKEKAEKRNNGKEYQDHNHGLDNGKASPVSTKQASKSSKNDEKIKKKKSKNDKDLNGDGQDKIKKPLSAYMLYNNYRRPTLTNEHPGNTYISLYSL